MLSIRTNLSSFIAQNSMRTSTDKLNQAIERMTTGSKINHAKDNAANYSISTNMQTRMSALRVAEDNVSMGLDLLATAESSLSNITDKITRLRALAVQASNGTYDEKSQQALFSEAEALITEVEREYLNCDYNGIQLFKTKTSSVDQNKRVVKQSSFVAGETYYVDKSEDLVKLQNLVNSGVDTTNVTFELTSDIDMTGVTFRGIGIDSTNCFKGTFDGQGHIISGLEINTTESYVGLFGYTDKATIENLKLVNCKVKGSGNVGLLVGRANFSIVKNISLKGDVIGTKNAVAGGLACSISTSIKNVYFIGSVSSSANHVGGIAGTIENSEPIYNCYSQGEISGNLAVGGIVGTNSGAHINNSFSDANVTGANSTSVGGVIGLAYSGVNNSYCTGIVYGGGSFGRVANGNTVVNSAFNVEACIGTTSVSGQDALTLEEIKAKYTPEYMGFTEANGWKVVNGELRLSWERDIIASLAGQHEVNLQVGASSEACGCVGFDISFDMSILGEIRVNGINSPESILTIDSILEMLSLKSTEYGTIQNRLMSVLDEISTQYENLASSRSTIRDADIAEVSSSYIKQQIIQQAGASLLASTQNIQYQNVMGLLQSLQR